LEEAAVAEREEAKQRMEEDALLESAIAESAAEQADQDRALEAEKEAKKEAEIEQTVEDFRRQHSADKQELPPNHHEFSVSCSIPSSESSSDLPPALLALVATLSLSVVDQPSLAEEEDESGEAESVWEPAADVEAAEARDSTAKTVASTINSLAPSFVFGLKGGARRDQDCVWDILERHPLLLGRSQEDCEKALLQVLGMFREVDFDHPLNFGRLKKSLDKMGARPVFDIRCSDDGRAVVELSVNANLFSHSSSRSHFSSKDVPARLVQALFSASDDGPLLCQHVGEAKVVAGYLLLWELMVSTCSCRSRHHGRCVATLHIVFLIVFAPSLLILHVQTDTLHCKTSEKISDQAKCGDDVAASCMIPLV
jgi:hypothetical protein